jgi:hypothetical protein
MSLHRRLILNHLNKQKIERLTASEQEKVQTIALLTVQLEQSQLAAERASRYVRYGCVFLFIYMLYEFFSLLFLKMFKVFF